MLVTGLEYIVMMLFPSGKLSSNMLIFQNVKESIAGLADEYKRIADTIAKVKFFSSNAQPRNKIHPFSLLESKAPDFYH